MTNYIIECKNKNDIENNKNPPFGRFTTTIQDKIMLEEGDQIALKSCFIDTQASSNQLVSIPSDIEAEITFIRYKMNNCMLSTMTPKSKRSVSGTMTTDTAVLDGRLYLATNQVNTPGSIRIMGNFKLEPVNKNGGTFGGFFFFLNYTNHVGEEIHEKHHIPETKINSIDPSSSDFLVSTSADFNTGQPFTITANSENGLILATSTNPTQRGTFQNCKLGNPTGAVPPGATPLFPAGYSAQSTTQTFVAPKFTKKFKIEGGNYDPHDLVEVINRQLDEVGTNNLSFNNLTDNTLLASFTLGVAGTGNNIFYVCPQKTNNLEESSPSFMELDYRFVLNVRETTAPIYDAYYLGTNQCNLDFSDATKKFSFEYNHFPFFKGGVESAGYFSATNNSRDPITGSINNINRYGGVLFTNLTATDTKTKQPSDFWSKILGFELDRTKEDCILVSYESELNAEVPSIVEQVFKPVFNPQPKLGVNFTAGFTGLDSAVGKGDLGSATAFPFIPVLGGESNPAGYFLSAVNKTSDIEAGDNVLSSSQDAGFGYYLIEVGSNFQTNFINENQTKKNVLGIVSKYYVKDSYTSAGEEASLIYQHQGEPMLLSSFDIRILDSDRNLATNIGDDNTIILQIIKAPPVQNKK